MHSWTRPIRLLGITVVLVMPAACSFCVPWKPSPQAIENNTFCAQYVQQGLLDQAEARCDIAIEYTGGKYAEPWNLKGQIAASRGHYDLAVEYFKRAISRRNDFAEAHNNLGVIFLKRRETAAAMDEFKQAIEYDPGYQTARRNYGNALLNEGEPEKAKPEFLKCIELDPGFCDCRMGLGVIALGGGNFDEAQGHFAKMIEVCPNDAMGYYNLCYTYLRKQLCSDAVTACVAAVAIDRECIECKKNLTEGYECLALQGGAVSKYMDEIAKNPGDPEPHFRLGTVFEEQKLYDNAGDEFLYAIRLSEGKHKLAHYRAARTFDQLARSEQVIEMCQRFVDLLRGEELSDQRDWCVNRVKQLQFQ